MVNSWRSVYKNRGVFILVDPYLIENLRDANGRIIKNYNNSTGCGSG